MSPTRAPLGFDYLESDIPPQMTLVEWRAARVAERAEQRQAARAARRKRWRARLGWSGSTALRDRLPASRSALGVSLVQLRPC